MITFLELFWSFFQIGLFSIGGGYAALPLIQAQVVDQYGWMTMTEFSDIITISQMTPGPIAINAATFVGIRIAGLAGAVVATLGCVFPSGLAAGGSGPHCRSGGVHSCQFFLSGGGNYPLCQRGGLDCRGNLPGGLYRPAHLEAEPHLGHVRGRGGRGGPLFPFIKVVLCSALYSFSSPKKTKLYIEFFPFSCYTLYKKWTVLSRSKESILFRLCYF